MNMIPQIIAGPTVSGKSSFALNLAEKNKGVIINADSLQVYKQLSMLTAQPSSEDMARVPHKLYGFLDGKDACSVGIWRDHALRAIKQAQQNHMTPYIVGGTGMYISILVNGLSPIPDVSSDIRQYCNARLQNLSHASFYEELIRLDPLMKDQIKPGDSQRMVRAYEVFEATGKSLKYWQGLPRVGDIKADVYVIERPRPVLHRRAEQRLQQMFEHGSIEEVKETLVQGYKRKDPVFQALGAKAIADYLGGLCSKEEAFERALIQTRQYIKRQSTWFKNQFPDATRITL